MSRPVSPDLAWLRSAITGRLELARAGQPDPADTQDRRVVRIRGSARSGSPAPALAAHIAANDPRAIIADCEKDLAILDEHATADYGYGPHCRTCFDVGDGIPQAVPCPCWTVALIAARYRHHPGWTGAGWTA